MGLSGTVPNTDQRSRQRGAGANLSNQRLTLCSLLLPVASIFGDVWNGAERPYPTSSGCCRNMWNLSRQSLADENNFQQFINLRQGFNETGGRCSAGALKGMEQITQICSGFYR